MYICTILYSQVTFTPSQECPKIIYENYDIMFQLPLCVSGVVQLSR